MANTTRQTIQSRKVVPSTMSRGSTIGTCCKRLSKSHPSLMCASETLRSIPDESRGSNPLEKEFEKYEEEYSLYLLRVLQSKIVQGEGEREEEAKKCLVSLKKEYEDLLTENVGIYEQIQKMESYAKNIVNLESEILTARKLLKVLSENEFDEVLNRVAQNLECLNNRLHLVGLKKENLDDALSQNVLGFDSDIYKLLKRMEEYTLLHKTLVPEIAEEVKEIQSLRAANEKLRERCVILAKQLRSKSIATNYEKFFEMAVKECRDIVNRPPADNARFDMNESSIHRSVALWEPTSSSTPTAPTSV